MACRFTRTPLEIPAAIRIVEAVTLLGKIGWIAYTFQPDAMHLWTPKAGLHRIVTAAGGASSVVFDSQRGPAEFGTATGTVVFWVLPLQRLAETIRFSSSR